MVETHGSQCGFCTPGFVMALAAWETDDEAQGEDALCAALAGNLCRCTGYGPILEAGRRVKANGSAPIVAVETPRMAALGYTRGDGASFYAPDTLEELLALRARYPEAVIVGGATDVGLWVTKQERTLPVLISTRSVPALRAIEESKDALTLGGAATYAEAFSALIGLHPALLPYLRRLGGPQVRESGTVGGNIANGSPIGDMPPVLIALGAEIELSSVDGARRLPVEDFFIAYGKQDRRANEVLTRIFIPRLEKADIFAAEKLSKRMDQDISAVSLGMLIRQERGTIAAARIAFGGLAGTPKRAVRTESALVGKKWSMAAVEEAIARLGDDFAPLSDHRASAAYRLRGAQGMLRRAFLRSSGDPQAPDLDRLLIDG
ncbi:MAG: FAD binding domain-containing protein [Alphaproteobacteria bacterium]